MTSNTKCRQPQKILRGVRVSIPKQWLEDNKMKVGDYVIVDYRLKQLIITPARWVTK